jgi:hypothetical protein
MSETTPKLRVIDEHATEPPEIVRLGKRGATVEVVERLPGAGVREVAARLESEERQLFEGRSQEPGVEAILDQEPVVENVEQPWGIDDGKLAGVPYGWFVLIVLMLVGAGAWSVHQMLRGEERLEVHHGVVREKVAQEKEEEKSARDFVDRVEKAAAAYLAADTLEEILPWVRDPVRVKPLIEAEWRERPKRSLKFERMTMFQPHDIGGGTFWVVAIEVRDAETQTMILEQIDGTDVKIDWETHVCHQPMAWDRYVGERPVGEVLEFRVRAGVDQHFSHEFSDSNRWSCFRLTAKGSENHLFGYAAAGGEVEKALVQLVLRSPSGTASVILRLRIPADCRSPRGVVIEEVVADQWLRVGKPAADAP